MDAGILHRQIPGAFLFRHSSRCDPHERTGHGTETSSVELDGLPLVDLPGRTGRAPSRTGIPQTAHIAGNWHCAGQRGLAGARFPRGASYSVALKIALATLLIDHTGEIGINSSYYPIYYVPIVTAAEYFGPWGTLAWTAVASAAYCSYLYPALQEYEITPEAYGLLTIRILVFFLAAMVVNRFVVDNRRQIKRYQEFAETLAETNRKLEQAQEEARRSERLAALGQMSAGLAHEIRNPLGVIKGSAEMLHQKLRNTNPLATELAGYISSETNRLSALVSRFLDFARPLHVDLVPQEITRVLEHALQSVSLAHKSEHPLIRVERQFEPDLPLVPLDEGLCEQAFVNLIQNAYDAMANGEGVLTLNAAKARSTDREGVEVRIEDTGPGIPEELRDRSSIHL